MSMLTSIIEGAGRIEPEDLPVDATDLFPPADVGHIHAGAYDVLQLGVGLPERDRDAP